MTYNFNRVLSSVTALALVLSLVAPASAAAQGAPVRKFSAAATPAVIAAPGTAEFTVTFTNDPTSDDDINAGRVTLPTGFTLQTPPTPTLDGVTDWEVCSAASEIQFGGIGNAPGVAPGDSFSVTFTAAVSAAAGEYSFIARAFKNSSCNPGGGAEFDSNITPIVVTVNSAPVANDAAIITAFETATSSSVSATDTDGDTLTYVVVTGAAHGTLDFNTDGSFIYTPNNGYSGADEFTFKANDGEEDSSIATVSITVNPSEGGNTAPVAEGGSIITDENTASSTMLVATDVDLDFLVYSIVTQALNGIAAITGNTVTYTPSTDYTGPDSFTYKANDGELDSNVAVFAVTVNPVVPDNATPVANPLALVTDYETATSSAVTATDGDGDPLTYATSTNPTNGALVFSADGSFTYTPNTGFSGVDSFMFRANDGKVTSASAVVSVTVNEQVVAPHCSDGLDNDGDELVDSADPGCHSDGDANNTGSYVPTDTDEIDVVTPPTGSDVSITKTVDDSTPDNGQTIVYTITVANAGPDAATNVVVTDVLPSGVTYVSDNSGGAYATSTGLWTVGTLADSASSTLQITATVSATEGQVVTNTASAEADGTDNDPADDAGSVPFTVNTPATPPSNGGGNGGGGGGGRRSSGEVLGASTGGEVLGQSCGLYMDKYLKQGGANDTVQVIKLQAFLNTQGLFNRVPSAVYDQRTENAVKDFQEKYFDDILKPWGLTAPTGLTYLTTLYKINMIECPALTLKLPPLTPWTKTTNTTATY